MGIGFFTSRDLKIKNPASLGIGCGKCRLFRNCQSPKMAPYGDGKRGLLIIGEAPGKNEDRKGIPFIGSSGQLLNKWLREYGVDPEKDIVKTNAVCCHPENNRTPTPQEIESCRGRLWKNIKDMSPKVILTFGLVPLQSLVSHRWFEEGGLGAMARWRGWAIPDRELGCWVCPTYHPAYVLRQEKNPVYEKVFAQDIKNAIRHLNKHMPDFHNSEANVKVLTNDDDIVPHLERILADKPTIVVDYETTGLKPFNDGHKIWYIGIADSLSSAMCFPTTGNKKALRLWRRICADAQVEKIAHHASYEDLWTRERLGVQMEGWKLCTMETAHVLDQRKGILSLKFQAYVKTGVSDYSSGVSPYLKPTDTNKKLNGDNAMNQIHLAPPKETMLYCGMDCLNTYQLAVVQCRELGIDTDWVRE